MHPLDIFIIFAKVIVPALGGPQTSCHCTVAYHRSYFAVTAVTFGFHFRIKCADAVFTWLKKMLQIFSHSCGGNRTNSIWRWLLSKTADRKCSICLTVHPSPLLFVKQALRAWLATYPQVFPTSGVGKIPKFFFYATVSFILQLQCIFTINMWYYDYTRIINYYLV
jgi:hypothetical protein